MAEVFTISGAMAPPVLPSQMGPSGGSAPPPVRLQNALKALGDTAGDPTLSRVQVDGVIGPKTVSAVNYALAHFVGATKYFPTANLNLAKVRQYAGGLAGLIEDRVHKSGGTVPPPEVHRAARRSSGAAAAAADVGPEPGTAGLFQNPQLVWWIGGGAVLVIALGFFAARRRKTA